MIRKIVLTGPESTGKTTLARQLALHFNTIWVEEAARQYLLQLGRPYEFDDLLPIAIQQIEDEKEKLKKANSYLFCDTGPLVVKVWSDFKFQKCDPTLLNLVVNHTYDHYLLCDIDLPWEPDPLREGQHDRQVLFHRYKKELDRNKLPYSIIQGIGNERLEHALSILAQIYK